jgi:hypothetical protein
MAIGFGDNVRIKDAPETRERGLAGLIGCVHGMTTPSVTSVEVIGELKIDYAVNVHFDELNVSYWLAPELLEFLDHGPGQIITLGGIAKKWTRTTDGEWIEESTNLKTRPWWKVW